MASPSIGSEATLRSPEATLSAPPIRTLPRSVAYGLAALVALFELYVVFLMLHPQVSADYRAYYLDRTTTCLPEPVSGSYVLGTTISFRSEGRKLAAPLKACGWLTPYGEGTPTKGETARLRFSLPPRTRALTLSLTLRPVVKDNVTSQRVVVSANGVLIDTLHLPDGPSRTLSVDIPPDVVEQGNGALDVKLDFPDAISFEAGGRGSNTQKRAILLSAVQLAPAVIDKEQEEPGPMPALPNYGEGRVGY
jgi:hypothetical protein